MTNPWDGRSQHPATLQHSEVESIVKQQAIRTVLANNNVHDAATVLQALGLIPYKQ